jgi:tellurium resistance protein TerD
MAIQLNKGSSINLSKLAPSLKKIRAGLSWDLTTQSSKAIDLDVSVFVCKPGPKCLSDLHFIFYNNLKSPEGFVEHTGDNRTGAGDGDDETILVDLSKAPAEASEVSIIVTIHEAAQNNHHFGLVKNPSIRIYNDITGEVLTEYKLADEFNGMTSLQVGSLFKNGVDWEFQAVGAGYTKELIDFLRGYGLDV